MSASPSAFVDESARGGYLLCAAVVGAGDLQRLRKQLRGLRRPGEARIHMASESPRFRRQLLSSVSAMPIQAYVYEAELAGRSQRSARDQCLTALVVDLARQGVDQVVLESCDQDRQDRRVIAEALGGTWPAPSPRYQHRRPSDEELLWLPDIVAWAHGAGGDWRRRANPIVVSTQRTG